MELLKAVNNLDKKEKYSIEYIYRKEIVIEISDVNDIENVIRDMIAAGVYVVDTMKEKLNNCMKYNKDIIVCVMIDYSDYVDKLKLYYGDKDYYVRIGSTIYKYSDIEIVV